MECDNFLLECTFCGLGFVSRSVTIFVECFFCFLQIQCVLQDVGSHIATPRDAATEKKLRKLVAENTKLVAEKTKLVAEDWLLSGL